jgi:hydroxysqualene synthase
VVTLDAAYDACLALARAHYENFPVASMLMPASMRHHVAAVYAFARAADDFADEGSWTAEERLALLDGWLERLRTCTASTTPATAPGEPAESAAIFQALGATIREKSLPIALFEDLISAFQQDVSVSRYPTWDSLLDYSRRSANPVGRLVLRIAGHDDSRLDRWSDAICTALQLTNFWQDLKVDFDRGRVYLPAADMQTHRADERELGTGHMTAGLQRTLVEVSGRTRALFLAGRPLCDALEGRLRYELRATWLGGMRVLDRLERGAFDVMRNRPSLGVADAPWFAWHMTTWGVLPMRSVAR